MTRTILIPVVVCSSSARLGGQQKLEMISAWVMMGRLHGPYMSTKLKVDPPKDATISMGAAGCDITHAQIDRVMLSIDHCLMPIARSSLCIFRVAVCWNFTCNVFVIYQNKATDTRLEMHNCVWANFAFSERAMLQLLKWPMYGLHAAHMYSSTVWISPVIDTRLIHGRGGIVAFQCQNFFSIFTGPLSR